MDYPLPDTLPELAWLADGPDQLRDALGRLADLVPRDRDLGVFSGFDPAWSLRAAARDPHGGPRRVDGMDLNVGKRLAQLASGAVGDYARASATVAEQRALKASGQPYSRATLKEALRAAEAAQPAAEAQWDDLRTTVGAWLAVVEAVADTSPAQVPTPPALPVNFRVEKVGA